MRSTIRRGAGVLLLLLLVFPCEAKKPKEKKYKMARYYLQHTSADGVSWTSDSVLNPSTAAFSVSVWIKGDTQLYKYDPAGAGWLIHPIVNSVGFGKLGIYTYLLTSTTDLDNGEWHHIVFTRSSSIMTLYIDGSSENTTTIGTDYDLDSTYPLSTYSTLTNGSIDDIRFYKGVVLSALQVSNIYNSGIGVRVKENGFDKITSNGFYASCDDGSGTTVSGRKLSSGTWSDHNGSFTSGDLTWVEGGVPFNSIQLTSDYEEYTKYINRTSKRIQFRFRSREHFDIREFKVLEPQVLGDR